MNFDVRNSLLALYLYEVALKSAFGASALSPQHDVTLTASFGFWSMREADAADFVIRARPHLEDTSRHIPHGDTRVYQNNRPITQPHCSRLANAVSKEKAAARDFNS